MICEWMKNEYSLRCWESFVSYTHTHTHTLINVAEKYFVEDGKATDVNSWSFFVFKFNF